mmetsp:Transcript_70912/g.203191  ORF Transcript_70912/g.203191 Transcript_70912/m.203191 type:complete len:445 (+) Transcript_70912:68-1402(+)
MGKDDGMLAHDGRNFSSSLVAGIDAATPLPSVINGVDCAPSVKVTRRQLTLNLIAGGLGTGMFSLPSSMSGCSVVLGVVMTFAVVALNALTIMILVRAADAHQVFDLGALLGLLPGRIAGRSVGRLMQAFMNIMVWVVLFGSLVSYLIVMHDSAQPFVKGTFLDDGRLPLVSFAALIVLGLCFLEQRHLSWTSSIALLVNMYLIIVLCILFFQKSSDQKLPDDVCLLGVGKGVVSMLAVLAQCVIIQMCVLPMYQELEDRSPQRFAVCLWTAFGSLALIFSLFATLGYLSFGPGVQGNVLQNVDSGVLSDIAQVGTILVVAAIYPLMVIPMVAPIRNMALPESLSHRRGLVVAGSIFVIVLISFVGALLIPDLLVVNVIDGALCVGTFTALAPGLAGLYLLDKHSLCWKGLMFLLFAFGFTNTVLGLVFSKPYAEELQANCAWA